MARTKRELTEKVLRGVEPAMEHGERALHVADVLKGPRTTYAALLTPIGYFLVERPRYVALTDRRLLLVTPPARGGGAARPDLAWPRAEIGVLGFERAGPWTRLVVSREGEKPVGLNFARPWAAEAEAIRAALA